MSNLRRSYHDRSAPGSRDAPSLATLRTADPDRYLQVLFARSNERPALLALFSLNVELARIADHANEPMAGYIRLQWWRDALAAIADGTEPGHPVGAVVAATRLVERLGMPTLLALVDARERELDATPMAGVGNVEAHARATAGALNRAVALLGEAPEATLAAAEAVGTAYGLLGIVRAVPFVLARSQPLLPAAGGIGPAKVDREALAPVLRALADRARVLICATARRQPRALTSAFVPAILARQDLSRLEQRDFDVFDGRLIDRPPWTAARVLAAIILGRY